MGDNGNAVTHPRILQLRDVTAENTDSTNDCDVVAGGLRGQGNYHRPAWSRATTPVRSAPRAHAPPGGRSSRPHQRHLGGLQTRAAAPPPPTASSLSDSVAVYVRADVSKAALVYTPPTPSSGKWVDNGFGNIWQEGTKDTVTKNTALAVDDISGNAGGQRQGRLRSTRAQASQWSTYAAEGWTSDYWQSVSDCPPSPALLPERDSMATLAAPCGGELWAAPVTIDNPAPRMGDTPTAVTTGLTGDPRMRAEMGTLSYQWMRSGSAISGAVDSYQHSPRPGRGPHHSRGGAGLQLHRHP